jgi:plasmid maintenance system antidote protein VapI
MDTHPADGQPIRLMAVLVIVSAIVNGRRAITADTALRLGKFFGVAPETWLNLQADYDLRVARDTTWRVAEPTVATYRAGR